MLPYTDYAPCLIRIAEALYKEMQKESLGFNKPEIEQKNKRDAKTFETSRDDERLIKARPEFKYWVDTYQAQMDNIIPKITPDMQSRISQALRDGLAKQIETKGVNAHLPGLEQKQPQREDDLER